MTSRRNGNDFHISEKAALNREGHSMALAPELREFLDRVVVPNLIKEFLAIEERSEEVVIRLAPMPVFEVKCAPISRPSAEGVA